MSRIVRSSTAPLASGREAATNDRDAMPMIDPALPPAQGLYNPTYEHDGCGVGFVADMKNRKSHDIVRMGIEILANLDHRGAVGADAHGGDGCGMLVQIPHEFFARGAGARLRST